MLGVVSVDDEMSTLCYCQTPRQLPARHHQPVAVGREWIPLLQADRELDEQPGRMHRCSPRGDDLVLDLDLRVSKKRVS